MSFRSLSVLLALLAGCTASGDAGGPAPAQDEPGPAPGGSPPVENPPLPPAAANAVITGDGVGCLRLGATPEEVRAACGAARDTTFELEGMRQAALVVETGGGEALAEIVDGRVWRVTVSGRGPATDDGIGVGTAARVLAAEEGARVNTGEGRYFLTTDTRCGLSFGIEGVPFDASAPTVEELRAAPETVRVDRVLVVGGC